MVPIAAGNTIGTSSSDEDSLVAGAYGIDMLTPTPARMIAQRYPARDGKAGLVSLTVMLFSSAFQIVSGCNSFLMTTQANNTCDGAKWL